MGRGEDGEKGLGESHESILLVEAVSASKLKKLESGFFSKQDPYVVFSVVDTSGKEVVESQKTATHQNSSAEPRWREKQLDRLVSFDLPVGTNDKDLKLVAQVMNDNEKKTHKLIGRGEVELGKVSTNGEISIALENAGKKAGNLTIFIKREDSKIGKEKAKIDDVQEEEEETRESSESDEQEEEEEEEVEAAGGLRDAGIPGSTSELVLSEVRAKKLKNLQMILPQDPFLVVTLREKGNEVTVKTEKSSGTNPKWKESLRLKFDSVPSEIGFQVLDAEVLRKARPIGEAFMPFEYFVGLCDDAGNASVEIFDTKGKSAGILSLVARIPDALRASGCRKRPEGKEDEVEVTRSQLERSSADLIPGKLTLTVIEGVKLKKVQRVGQQDPFVIATLLPWEIKSKKTKTMSGRNPKWMTGNVLEFDFPGKAAPGQVPEILVEVFDEEMMMKPRFIGSGVCDISPLLMQEEETQVEIPLQDRKFVDAGLIVCKVKFKAVDLTQASDEKREEPQQAFKKEGRLVVEALSAKLTRSVEVLSKQDPLMEVILLPWAGELQSGKTKPVTNAGKQVEWTEEHQNRMQLYYPGTSDTGEASMLSVILKDDEMIMSDRVIGSGKLLLEPLLREMEQSGFSSPKESEVELFYQKTKKLRSCGNCRIRISFDEGSAKDFGFKDASIRNVEVLEASAADVEKTESRMIFMTVKRGQNLKNRARWGKQDPYVKLTLNPWCNEVKTQSVKDGGVSPEWTPDHGSMLRIRYPGARNGEIPCLLVEVFDDQMGGDRLIGSRILSSSAFLRSEDNRLNDFEIPLISRGGKSIAEKPAGSIFVDVHSCELKESTSTRCGVLRVTLEEVSSSKKADWFSKNDVYVRLRLQPGLKHSGFVESTTIQNAGLATSLDETLEVPMFDFGSTGVGANMEEQKLRVELMDRDTLTSNDSLGIGLKELGEVLSDKADASYSHEINLLRKGKKSVGTAYAKLKFIPNEFIGAKAIESMKCNAGTIRIWALEARNLKHVAGMLDRKQDPYLRVAFEKPGENDPGKPTAWPSKLRSGVAVDAGKKCVWNEPIDVAFSEADAAFMSSGQKPGFLHLAVLDEGILDTVIGVHKMDLKDMILRRDEEKDDFWVLLVDPNGHKSGEARLAIEFVPRKDTELLALRKNFAYVPKGFLHLYVANLEGLPRGGSIKKVAGQVFLNGKSVDKLPSVDLGNDAEVSVCFMHVAQLAWEPEKLNPDSEPVMDIPMLRLDFFATSGGVFGRSKSLGSAYAALSCFGARSPDGRLIPIEKVLSLSAGAEYKDSFQTIRIVGIFVPKQERVPQGLLEGMAKNQEKKKRSQVSGRLHLRVLQGKDLKSMDSLGKQDPYVKGMLIPGGSVFSTDAVMDGGKTPRWTKNLQNSHVLLVEDAESAFIKLECFDKDDVSDDFIGMVEIPLLPVANSSLSISQSPNLQGSNEEWKSLLGSPSSVEATRKIFRTSRWSLYVSNQWKAFSNQQQKSSRRKRLEEFYHQLEEDGIAAVDDIATKVDKLHSKYPDDPETNKDLFEKLFQRYRPDEECPEELWKEEDRRKIIGSGATQFILRSLSNDSVQFFAEDDAPVVDDVDELVTTAETPFRKETEETLSANSFQKLAEVCLAALIGRGGSGNARVSGQGDVLDENVPGGQPVEDTWQKLWWTLKDSRGRKCGLLQLEMKFTFDWEPAPRLTPPELLLSGLLRIEVEKATFSTDKDWIGKQDPFVSIQWSGKKTSFVKTSVKKNSGREAEWNESLQLSFSPEIAHEAYRAGQTPAVHIQVRDSDMAGSDLIGETKLPFLTFAKLPGRSCSRELALINPAKGETTNAGRLHLKIVFEAEAEERAANESSSQEVEMHSRLFPDPLAGRATIRVIRARGLKDMQWIGRMDPEVSVRIWPTNEIARTGQATNHDKNPVWNETFPIDLDDARLALMEISVSDGSKRIGNLEVPLCVVLDGRENIEQNTELENWFPLVHVKGKKVSRRGEIQLGIKFKRDCDEDAEEDARNAGAIRFVPGPGKLHLRIRRAVDLHTVNLIGKQDPFVEVSGLFWRKAFKAKSEVDENGGANPVFNFQSGGVLEWGPKDKQVPSLQLEIKDRGALKNSSIFCSNFSLVPWLLSPGQISSFWFPTYDGKSKGGPYEFKAKNGALLMDAQFLPDASFEGKPSSEFSRAALKRIREFEPGAREGDVHVQVIGARNLVDVQALGTQDPFVKLTLVSGGTHEDARLCFTRARTLVINNGGSNPSWNEDLLLPYSEKSLGIEKKGSTPYLLVEIWDANPKLMGDELIGRTIVPIFPFILDAGQIVDSWFPVTREDGRKMGEVHLGVQFRRSGEAKRVIPSEMPENILNVVVLRGINLHNVGDGLFGAGSQDPRVILEFVGSDEVYKTQVAKNEGTEPTFDERIRMKGCLPDARGTFPRLRCNVVDDDLGTDGFIGMFEFSLTKEIMGINGKDPRAFEQRFQLYDRKLKENRGELHMILKRGPFASDVDNGTESVHSGSCGKAYLDVLKVSNLSNFEGRVPKKVFIRATCEDDSSKIGEADSATFSLDASGTMEVSNCAVIVSIPKVSTSGETRISFRLGIYERRWSIRGKTSVLVAECVLPKAERLLSEYGMSPPREISLPLRAQASAEGAALGEVAFRLQTLPRVAGQLQILVESVSGVKSKEMFRGKNDLRVEAEILNGAPSGSMSAPEHTSTKNDAGSGATWNETLSLLYSNELETKNPLLQLRVVDVDTISNDLCGICDVDFRPLIVEGFKQGPDGRASIEVKNYLLQKGIGEVNLGLTFIPDHDVFERKRKEENKQILELKRMWNVLDENKDGRLTKEELIQGFKEVPDCCSFLGVDARLFSPEKLETQEGMEMVSKLFDEMNTNDDDIVDFEEFRIFVESKPLREKAEKLRSAEERNRALLSRQEEREKLGRKRAHREQEELEEKRRIQQEETARKQMEKKKKDEMARIKQEEDLARLAAKRAQEELDRLKSEAGNIRKEKERQRRAQKRASRLEHQRHKDVMLWRTRDVVEWLAEDLELPSYCTTFTESAVDGPLLVVLSDQDLESDLGVHDPLHRRKILLRAARLFELHKEITSSPPSKRRMTRSKSPKTRKQASTGGVHLTAENPAQRNELLRIKLAQQLKREESTRKAQEKEDQRRKQLWHFEYGSKPKKIGSDDAFDWYDQHKADLQSDDESSDEESFRLAMTAVRTRIVGQFGPPRRPTDATSFKLKRINESVTSSSPKARRIKSLPPDRWFEDKQPWWTSEGPTSSLNQEKTIPEGATAEEIVSLLGSAIREFGMKLALKRKRETRLSSSFKESDQEKQRLIDAFDRFCLLESNSGAFNEKLSRLKFDGAVQRFLDIKISWSQLDRAFRVISPPKGDGTDGTIQFEEFYEAFRTKAGRNLSPLNRRHPLRGLLFKICERLVASKITLKELFRGFDRNGLGEISTAEFNSMIRSLSHSVTKQQVYDLMRCMDSDVDRKITFSEFMDFWLVIFTNWLEVLESKITSEGAGTLNLASGRRMSDEELRRLINRVEETIELSFGTKKVPSALPGPMSSLLRSTGLQNSTFEESPRGNALDAIRSRRRNTTKYGSNELKRIAMKEKAEPRRSKRTLQMPASKNFNEEIDFMADEFPSTQ